MQKSIALLSLLFSFCAQANLKIGYIYPHNKKERLINVYKVKSKAYVSLTKQDKKINRDISEPLYQEIKKNFLSLANIKKKLEFSCPMEIKFTLEVDDKKINYCKSSKLKKSVARLFNRLNKIIEN